MNERISDKSLDNVMELGRARASIFGGRLVFSRMPSDMRRITEAKERLAGPEDMPEQDYDGEPNPNGEPEIDPTATDDE